MGGEVTVYSGFSAVVEAVGGMEDISSNESPGISMPLIGGIDMPPIMSEDIMVDDEELENDDEEENDCFDMEDDPMFMDPMPDIILFIMPSMSKLGMLDMPPNEGICIDIIPPGIGPPDDIIVLDEDDDEVDLKLEIVDPSSDCVTAAMLWLLAFSSFLTAVPSSVT